MAYVNRRRQTVVGAAVICGMTSLGINSHGDSLAAARARQSDDMVRNVVEGTSTFGVELYKELGSRDGNVVCSPLSVSMALAGIYAGARGQTAQEIASVVHLTDAEESVHPAFATLLNALSSTASGTSGPELRLANALWVQRQYSLLPHFVQVVGSAYQAEPREIDFAMANAARRSINTWAERASGGALSDLVPSSLLDGRTKLVTTSIMYLRTPWARQFTSADTRDAQFSVTSSRDVRVRMMRQTATFKFLDGDTIKALELPYGDGAFAMLLLLPKSKDGLNLLEMELNNARLLAWVAEMHDQDVEVAIPRMRISSGLELKSPLTDMGMRRAFEAGAADFSGISAKRGLYLEHVLHRTRVDVNEAGTEATAGTAVIGKSLSIGPTATFNADHPFLFVIRHVRTGAILVLGRVVDPTV